MATSSTTGTNGTRTRPLTAGSRLVDPVHVPDLPAGPRPPTPWDAIKLPSLRNLTLALLVATLCAGVAVLAVLKQSPVYQSSATLLIDQPKQAVETGDAGPLVKLNALRLKYVSLVDTSLVADPVAKRLQLSPGQVRASASAYVGPESLLLYAGARAGSGDEARRIAQAVADQLVSYARQEQDANHVAPDVRVQLSVVDAAYPGAKISPTNKRALVVAGFVGALALAGAYVGLQLATARRRLA